MVYTTLTGLISMRERMRLVHGEPSLDSGPGRSQYGLLDFPH
jgi:hypothetical protein